MNFVCTVFELGDKTLTLSSMENLIVQCNQEQYIRSIIPRDWTHKNYMGGPGSGKIEQRSLSKHREEEETHL